MQSLECLTNSSTGSNNAWSFIFDHYGKKHYNPFGDDDTIFGTGDFRGDRPGSPLGRSRSSPDQSRPDSPTRFCSTVSRLAPNKTETFWFSNKPPLQPISLKEGIPPRVLTVQTNLALVPRQLQETELALKSTLLTTPPSSCSVAIQVQVPRIQDIRKGHAKCCARAIRDAHVKSARRQLKKLARLHKTLDAHGTL